MLSNIERSTIKVASKLSVWDETIINFNDSTYYQYWKETRVHDTEVFDYAIDSVELYKADGVALVPGSTISDRVIEKATARSVVMNKQGEPFLIYFNPVYFQIDVTKNRTPDGYIAISVNIKNAIESRGMLSRSNYRDIKWKLKEGEIIRLKDILNRVELGTYDSPEIEEFSKLLHRSFSQYIIYSIVLLICFYLLLVIFLGRPLQRLALHVQNMHDGRVVEIPKSILSGAKIAELEQLRRAVNEYRNNFHEARNTLIEQNLELEELTNLDALTGIFNRRAFESHLQIALKSARDENTAHALCYMDLDQFKVVNDTCGHVAGDELLKQISSHLQVKLREADIL
ncbi:MAG: diguanylate cyclase, partial [Gammaproteobacteria bacterium]|nr:diguanylate cyclase [Gammaproteobacteria bacterium]